ncbi:MAG: Mrp/NBP35 family ATP-binding protein [Planctomycetes bacterium]|nr:Mrp/NBP35 family ATP-binding protein [Planctomycetota bacterium]
MHTEADVKAALKGVQDPDLHKDLVDLGMIKDIKTGPGVVELTVELTTPACPLKEKIAGDVTAALKTRLGVAEVKINMTANTARLQKTAVDLIPGVRNVVFVASGKGGVGKSTVAANLAVSLGASGAKVGLLDADIYGPSLPTMFGIRGEQPGARDDKTIIPLQRHGLKLMSMGFLLEDGQPVIWRGPMLDSALGQFLGQVDWGDLDYLIVDLPPGTGDVQMSLARMVPGAVAVIVTTPQDVALADVQRAIGMFGTVKVQVLGVVENMSTFVCGHCGKETHIFGAGAADKAAARYNIANLGSVPLTEAVVQSGDTGLPIVASRPSDPAAIALSRLARQVAQAIAVRAAGTLSAAAS